LPSFRAKKSFFDLQLPDLPKQIIDLCLASRIPRRLAALEDARGAVQKLLLPVINLVRVNPVRARSSAIVRSPLIAASATFALNAPWCFVRVSFMSCSRASVL
jgi:hypothetical protein